VAARALCVLRDPGPMTDDLHGGSGFLSPDNDAPHCQAIRSPARRRLDAAPGTMAQESAGVPLGACLSWSAARRATISAGTRGS